MIAVEPFDQQHQRQPTGRDLRLRRSSGSCSCGARWSLVGYTPNPRLVDRAWAMHLERQLTLTPTMLMALIHADAHLDSGLPDWVHKVTARALSDRRLIEASAPGYDWRARCRITPVGRGVLAEHRRRLRTETP